MENSAPNMLMTFIPLILMTLMMAIPAHLLAKDRGRNTALWTVLALVPVVNIACIWYFVGAPKVKRR